jgi:HEPN domain-containing protein
MNETAKIWIDLARSDLKSSRLLYDNRHHRTSYFFFQQASEKANKAFAHFTGLLSEKQFKDLKHDQLKIYRKTIAKQEEEIKTLVHALKPYPKVANLQILQQTNFTGYQKTLSESLGYIDSLRRYDLVNIPTQDLNFILGQIKTVKNTKLKIPRDFEPVLKTQMIRVADWIGQFETQNAIEAKAEFLKFMDAPNNSKMFYELIVKKILPMVIDIAFVNLALYFCAIITEQHSSLTRYPYNNVNPDIVYKKGRPLVKKQKEFMDLLGEALLKLTKINAI